MIIKYPPNLTVEEILITILEILVQLELAQKLEIAKDLKIY